MIPAGRLRQSPRAEHPARHLPLLRARAGRLCRRPPAHAAAGGHPGLNGFVLYFALPCMLYRFGSTTPIAQLLDAAVAGVYLLCALVMVAFAIVMTMNRRIRWNDASLGALVAAFPNTGFMGVPLLVALLGPRRRAGHPDHPGRHGHHQLAVHGAVAAGRARGPRPPAMIDAGKKALKGVATNPMPWAILLGARGLGVAVHLPGRSRRPSGCWPTRPRRWRCSPSARCWRARRCSPTTRCRWATTCRWR
jgi:hypothetical protein